MISVVIRNKNQKRALTFLLKNLTERYAEDISEILVIDNESTDGSIEIAEEFGARVVTVKQFSYGGSANIAANAAKYPFVVIFSAHSYPVSHDFFKLIKEKFNRNQKLAGLRCLHSPNDYRNYINKVSAKDDANRSGLIFSGSAFSKDVWKKHPFREDVSTFEDKEWSKRVLESGYDIEFVNSIFSYEIKRTRKQVFFRFKNDVVGNYQLWHTDVYLLTVFKQLLADIYGTFKRFFVAIYYSFKRFVFRIKFILNKPSKF
ncbi:glycosyltransferase (GT2) [Formosa agariphila KMM 3901]|uniref:Glycosyltransferase (GT2) n=1 Tax=Formosa agariphila (strain DSM 15362 / KCTC 12365 / LMG 23005 / KMM 3901 / M-2Alg 35-1) TaxID=1347342 RepID=T2KNK8_FORAG|nr:glycosyltransferase [Formosa agariphila]CDF80031.1 glycosyltransferase (GT2) [Formosa agariphila KMM 3901]